MISREYQKSNLALELKAGKKRLEDALHVLSDEQCARAGARGLKSLRGDPRHTACLNKMHLPL